MAEPATFEFYTERRLVGLTGITARNLDELLGGIERVPGSSIFYHTHQQYLAHHFQKPVFNDDFALWIAQALQQDALAERLSAIDLLSFTAIRGLREEILATIRSYLEENPAAGTRGCPPGDEFHFCRSKSFVLPTGIVARTPAEFFENLHQVTNVSLYFHFFEARLRLCHPTNDFSQWLSDQGEADLAQRINSLDPYIRSLDELKADIIALGAGRTWQ
jgi:hypothetical protein